MCLVALWLKWCNISAALKIVFMGHVEPNLTVKILSLLHSLTVVSFAFPSHWEAVSTMNDLLQLF